MTRVDGVDKGRLDDHLVVADGDHDRAQEFEGADDLLIDVRVTSCK